MTSNLVNENGLKTGKIRTFSGLLFDVLNPDPADIRIEDVAHHLSNICRFTGGTRFHYSVGQHSLIGSYLVPKEHARCFLLHDTPEAYINDMARPVKYLEGMGLYRDTEQSIWLAVAEKFDLPVDMPACVKEVDDKLCATEGFQLIKDYVPRLQPYDNLVIGQMSPEFVESQFLARYYELSGLQ
jgi:hypothetical protein